MRIDDEKIVEIICAHTETMDGLKKDRDKAVQCEIAARSPREAEAGRNDLKTAQDSGYIWFKRGSPWYQSLSDNVSKKVKRRYLNITAEDQPED